MTKKSMVACKNETEYAAEEVHAQDRILKWEAFAMTLVSTRVKKILIPKQHI